MKKRYYNSTTKEWYTEGNSLTRRVNGALFSGIPSVEQLTAWGFVEWVEPDPTPEEALAIAKSNKIAQLEAYNDSDEINKFTVVIGNDSFTDWLTPNQRANYKNSIDSAELLNMQVVKPVINGIEVPLNLTVAKTALAKIQIYADRCFGVTEKHRAAINALNTIAAVDNYNFKTGYPAQEIFTV